MVRHTDDSDGSDHKISNVRHVFGADKAIRSDSPNGTVWFYRTDADGPILSYQPDADAGPHDVPIDVVRRNVDHDDTDPVTVPVDESPFADGGVGP